MGIFVRVFFVVMLIVATKTHAQSNDSILQNGLVEYIAAAELAEFILQQAAVDDETDPFFDNVRLLEAIDTLRIGRYDRVIDFDTSSRLTLSQISEIEQSIESVPDLVNLAKQELIDEITARADAVASEFDVYNLAQDVYQFGISFNEVVDTSSPLNVRLDSAIDLSVNARSAILNSIAVSNTILRIFPESRVASAARFWAKNRVSKGFVRIAGPQSSIAGPVTAILIGAELQASLFTSIKAIQDNEIKDNLFENGIANSTRRNVIVRALTQLYIESEESGQDIQLSDITLLPPIRFAANVFIQGFSAPVNLPTLIRDHAASADFDSLSNDAKIHVALDALGVFASSEDVELSLALTRFLDDVDLASNVFATILRRDSNEFNLVSGESLRTKFFPYRVGQFNARAGDEYYASLFKIFFNGEVASYTQSRLATLGNTIEQLIVDANVPECEITNTCNSLPIVTGVQASDGTFQDRVRVVWNQVSNATEYDVLRCEPDFGASCIQIATTDQTLFDERALPAARDFSYRIRACNEEVCSAALSEFDSGFIQANVESDNFVHVSDSVVDGTLIEGGAVFSQRQRLRNNGETTWDSSYCLRSHSGPNFGLIDQVCVSGNIRPGEEFIFEIPMRAPQAIPSDALLRNYWSLEAGLSPFPSLIYTEILVPGELPTASRPTSISAIANNASTIMLSWPADQSGNVYRVERAIDGGDFSFLIEVSALEFVDAGRLPETRYRYRVQRCGEANNESCSEFSPVAEATTPASADASSLIANFNISDTNPQRGSTVDISATLENGGGVANGDRFQFVFALSADNDIDSSGDTILLTVPEQGSNFRLTPGDSETIVTQLSIADNANLGGVNVLACALYRDLSDSIQQQCQAQPIVVLEQPLDAPSVPSAVSINYNQGASSLSVDWNRSTGGSFFILERSINANGGFSQVFSGNGVSYIDNDIVSGTSYFYRLRACQNSLISSCSAFSLVSTVGTLSDATNDLFIADLEIGTNGNLFTAQAEQIYVGTSRDIIAANIGFFLSTDEFCSENDDLFIAEGSTGFSRRDTMDNEGIEFSIPPALNGQQVYLCAIADYEGRVAEQDENNNSFAALVRTNVPAPTLRTLQTAPSGFAAVSLTWSRLPGISSYILNRIIDGQSPLVLTTDNVTSFVDNRLPQCERVSYRLDACSAAGACSSSAEVTGFTLPRTPPAPIAEVVSVNRIEVSWNNSDCAGFYILERANGSGSFDVVNSDSSLSYQDTRVFPGSTIRYRIQYCSAESEAFIRNGGCSSFSPTISVTVPALIEQGPEWVERNISDNVQGIISPGRVKFRNSLFNVGGSRNGELLNSVLSSKDGLDWDELISSAEFSPRRSPNLVVHNDTLFLIGGRLADGSYSSEVWSTTDGTFWTLVTENAPFGGRVGTRIISFNDKLVLVGGRIDDASSGSLADIWVSENGLNWTRVVVDAPFGNRNLHSLLVINENQLILFGGSVLDNGETVNPQLWATSDGVSWELVRSNLPFGERQLAGAVEFDGRFWMIGGRRFTQDDASENDTSQRFEPDYQTPFVNDVWVSDNGLDWAEVAPATRVPTGEMLDVINFNNTIFAGRFSASRVWSANYGARSNQPDGSIVLTGAAVVGANLQAELSDIDFQFEDPRLTYHWFRNGGKIETATEPVLSLNDFEIGDEISLTVRYQSDALELWEFTSDSVTLFGNPIETTFESEQLNVSISQVGIENRLLNMGGNVLESLTVENTAIATVNAVDNRVLVSANAIGTTLVSAIVSDSSTSASRELEFVLDVSRSSVPISFVVEDVRVSINDGMVSLPFSPGSLAVSSSDLSIDSSNPSVATVTANGTNLEATLIGVGVTTISVTRPESSNFLESSTSIDIEVFLDDFDRDGVADEIDNCPNVANLDQQNSDSDQFGDVCDQDDDSDFIVDASDCAALDITRWQLLNGFADPDSDGIGSGDAIVICSGLTLPSPFVISGGDNCANLSNSGQENFDSDTQGDACDFNDDNDPFDDALDCAQFDSQRWQVLEGFLDIDQDGVGFGLIEDVCSGENLPITHAFVSDDNCQFDVNPNQVNTDNDESGDVCDNDDDDDAILDGQDNCQFVPNPEQIDSDEDGIGDDCQVEEAGSDQALCFPIITNNGGAVLVCL